MWTHRWTALVLGLVLLVVCTSGVPLLWHEEIVRAQHPEAYQAAGPATMSFDEVAAVVARHDSSFQPQSMYHTHGVIVADDFESGRRVSVDPSNGRVLADFNPVTEGGFVNSTMGLMYNLHLCLLSCEEYPGYQQWLAAQVPGTAWLGVEGEKVTWGGLLLGVMGLMLLFLAVSGVWLWWPGFKHWVRGVRVRWRKGRYARDYDLHQVAGMIALPLLLIWAVTGMGYEFGFVEKSWYQAVPGEASPEVILESAETEEPDIGLAAAVAAAQRAAGTDEEPMSVDLPHADEPTSTYGVWFADGFDPWNHSDYAGDMLVSVDRHDAAKAEVTYGGPGVSMAQELWEDYNLPTHSGLIVNGIYCALVALLGLLAAAGVPCVPALRAGLVVAQLLLPLLGALPGRRRPAAGPARADHLAAAVAALVLLRRPGRRLPGTEREEPDERLHADRDRLPQQPGPGPAGHRRS